jgi:hypothetical protein
MQIRIECGFDSRSRAGVWPNDRAGVRAVWTIQGGKNEVRIRFGCGLDSRIYIHIIIIFNHMKLIIGSNLPQWINTFCKLKQLYTQYLSFSQAACCFTTTENIYIHISLTIFLVNLLTFITNNMDWERFQENI